MVVQHNLTAMNANRQLGITTGQQAKSSEKLPRFSKMTLSLPTSDQSKNMSFGKLKPICRPIQKFRSFPGTRWQEPKNQAPKPALTHCLKGAGSL